MNISLVLDMAAAGFGDRTAVVDTVGRTDFGQLDRLAWGAARAFRAASVEAVVYIGTNHLAYPVCLFGAARAGIPLVPLNYRLSAAQLELLLSAHRKVLVVYSGALPFEVAGSLERDVFLEMLDLEGEPVEEVGDQDLPAVLLYTSGTTAAPKAAILRHRHLLAYLFGSVEFGGADADDAALVTVPPYHVAGLTNLLSNMYAARRLVYLEGFDPHLWLTTVQEEGVTQAMVVPTMLARIMEHLSAVPKAYDLSSLRLLSYGGARMPRPVLECALQRWPHTGFVNAYGLTETSSTIALLGPEDHREAFASASPPAQARLGSVGRLLPGIELQVRGEGGEVLAQGEPGLLYLRGDQISGEYSESSVLNLDGWFPTRDRGWLDSEGFLFIEGRADDTIIRGGENIAPAEIEDVLLQHEGVKDVVVVGVPDDVWGQQIVAVVVRESESQVPSAELQEWVRDRLRSSKTPDAVHFRDDLPRTDTGKLLRRAVLEELCS